MSNDADRIPLSSLVGERGIKTTKDFADFMGALMADLVAGRIDYETAKGACMAGDKIIQVAKLQMEYSKLTGDGDQRLARPGVPLIQNGSAEPPKEVA